jgi:EAL domain-containing protein (putative c-di-GMP-specific phosphodiesterase class I)
MRFQSIRPSLFCRQDYMEFECALCSFRQRCSETSPFLYAATPILRQIVSAHLQEIGAAFERKNDLFRLGPDGGSAIEKLRRRLSEAERADIRVGSEPGAALMAAPTLEAYGQSQDTQWFEEALRNDSFTSFFQPIVDTRHSSVFAHECLIRLFADRPYNGAEIVEAAISRGSVHLFDSYARRLSIRQAGAQFTPGSKIFINFMPSSIYDPAFCMASTLDEMSRTTLQPTDVVFEVVESDKVRDVRHLQKICEYYRKEGFGFALDDVGTGSSSLQMVCDLKPDYIKLDKSFISNVAEPMYCRAVEKLTEFAFQSGLDVIAEGIEAASTMETLQAMGIHLMQGYYFGKPAASMNPMTASLANMGAHLQSETPAAKSLCPSTS